MLELCTSVNRLSPLKHAKLVATLLALVGCSPDTASHVPNPLLLPGYALGNVVGNASYNARRARVKHYITANFDALLLDIKLGGGATLTQASDLARIPQGKRPALIAVLAQEPNLSRDPEALSVTLMVHGP